MIGNDLEKLREKVLWIVFLTIIKLYTKWYLSDIKKYLHLLNLTQNAKMKMNQKMHWKTGLDLQ